MVIGRRAWLKGAGATAAGLAWGVRTRGDSLGEVEARAKAVGLGPFRRTESDHYVVIGDASQDYREPVAAACEAMAAEFLKHYKARSFEVAMPREKLVVVALADGQGYAKFVGEAEGLAVGGQYDPPTNRLTIFDYRSSQGELAANARQINSFTLGHEANHQLTFNVGLLDRAGDVPRCVSEGLATYGETWRWDSRDREMIGTVNRPRLRGLGGGVGWIPMAELFVEDELLDGGRRDAAYAESWVLIHAHMKQPARLPKLRAYLEAIRGRRDAKHRLEDAQAHLGDLAALDKTLRAWAKSPKGR